MINAHAETLFGYRRDELVGQKIEVLVPRRSQASHPGFRETYRSTKRGRGRWGPAEISSPGARMEPRSRRDRAEPH
jgi:PAS domain S-box-containing protein